MEEILIKIGVCEKPADFRFLALKYVAVEAVCMGQVQGSKRFVKKPPTTPQIVCINQHIIWYVN
jgi:hypothetical protein